jgi:hypothetical protein
MEWHGRECPAGTRTGYNAILCSILLFDQIPKIQKAGKLILRCPIGKRQKKKTEEGLLKPGTMECNGSQALG